MSLRNSNRKSRLKSTMETSTVFLSCAPVFVSGFLFKAHSQCSCSICAAFDCDYSTGYNEYNEIHNKQIIALIVNFVDVKSILC